MPDSYRTSWYRGRCLTALGRADEGAAEIARAVDQANGIRFLRAFHVHALAQAGDTASAEALLEEIKRVSATEYVSPMSEAVVYLGLGRNEEALDALERALERRSGSLVWLKVDAIYDPLRDDPLFDGLLDAVGLG